MDQANIAVYDLYSINIFVKTNKVSIENGKLYNKLFDARQEGDYIDFVYFDDETVEPWIPEVKNFIEAISQLLNE